MDPVDPHVLGGFSGGFCRDPDKNPFGFAQGFALISCGHTSATLAIDEFKIELDWEKKMFSCNGIFMSLNEDLFQPSSFRFIVGCCGSGQTTYTLK
jgi:hypothetical protein